MASTSLIGAVLSIAASVLLVSRKSEDASISSYAGSAFTFFFLFMVANLVYSVILYPIFFTPFKHLSVPPGRSLINGHFSQFLRRTPGLVLRDWAKVFPNDGILRIYMFGNSERLFVTTTKGLSDVFVHKAYDFVKPDQLKASMSRLAGMGILLVEGDEHKKQRKHLNPAFAFRHVKDLYPVFWAKSVEMVQRIESTIKELPAEKKVVEIKDWASRATLDIIGVAGMDRDFEALQHPNNTLNRHYRKSIGEPERHIRIILALAFFIHPKLSTLLPIQFNRDINEGAKAIRAECRHMIAAMKAKLEKGETMGVDILSVAMQSGGFSDENLVDQMMTFLLAGHETTSTALQWVVYALCKHPSIQTRLRSEIREKLPSSLREDPSQITAAQIDSLPYLNAVCNEVLRFHPPVPLTARKAIRETIVDNQPIPKGTGVIMCTETINRNPEYWGPDAGVFDPERWLVPGRAKTGGAENNYALLTFIHGPRSCIGQGFSKSELACLVAAMVGRFEMELEDPEKELKIGSGITQAPLDGVRARIKVLEGW